MSKYNKGDKFVIEIDEVFRNDVDDIIHEEELYRIRGFKSLMFDDYGLDKLHQAITPAEDSLVDKSKVEEAYNKGLEDGRNEAWELAKKLVLLDSSIGWKIFGTCRVLEVLENFTPQEALAKLEAYEKEQAEIKVGDVIERTRDNKVIVVCGISDVNYCGLMNDGRWTCLSFEDEITKTGKHIDIQSMLEQIGGAE